MPDPEKTYIMTFRHDARQPEGWQQTLAQTPGVTLVSTLGRQARIKCNPAALQNVREHFPNNILIEEDRPRYV